jgi:hypothetical protein
MVSSERTLMTTFSELVAARASRSRLATAS